MKRAKKIIGSFIQIAVFLMVLAIWFYSGYKIFNYLKLNKILGSSLSSVGAFEGVFPSFPPEPPLPPEPPCPPPCPPQCPTATPTLELPILTPTPTEIILTPTPTVALPSPTPTPTIFLEATPTPTLVMEEPTPTPSPPPPESPPGVGGPPGEAGPPHCGAQTPPAPYLRRVVALGGNEVELFWDPVEPATHYSLSYGPSSGNYLYGVPNTGKVSSFKVGALGGRDYCFAVRAVNDCAPSELSNEKCTGEISGIGGQVLGAKIPRPEVLGATGTMDEDLFMLLFAIGNLCLGIGIRISYPAIKKA